MDNEMNKASETTVTAEVVPPVVKEPTFKGHIRNCTKLNVRVSASLSARILCTIGVDDEVEIDRDHSVGEFWKVRLQSGIEGYCMKKFIKMVKL